MGKDDDDVLGGARVKGTAKPEAYHERLPLAGLGAQRET